MAVRGRRMPGTLSSGVSAYGRNEIAGTRPRVPARSEAPTITEPVGWDTPEMGTGVRPNPVRSAHETGTGVSDPRVLVCGIQSYPPHRISESSEWLRSVGVSSRTRGGVPVEHNAPGKSQPARYVARSEIQKSDHTRFPKGGNGEPSLIVAPMTCLLYTSPSPRDRG